MYSAYRDETRHKSNYSQMKIQNYKIWFYSEKTLEDIADILLSKGIISSYEYDYENVYEWIEAQHTDNSFNINISRKHSYNELYEEENQNQHNSNITEPVTLMLMYENTKPSDSKIEYIASKINTILNTQVYLGNINYMGGDNYEYVETKKID